MLNNVFNKTLFERRWGMLWWSMAIFATTLLIMLLFPTFRDTFGASLENVPESLKSVLGQASDYQRIEGFVELQVLMQLIFYTVIYGIILFTGLIAGDEGQGTLQTLLTNPITRSKVYFQKLAAGSLILVIVSLAMFLGIWLGAAMIDVSIDVGRMLQGTFALWLVTLVYSLVGYTIGAVTGRRGIAGGIAGVFAFATYLITSLAATVEGLKILNYASPFKYFNTPRVLENGLLVSNTSILIITSIVLIVVGWLVFRRRDIYQP